MQTQQRNPHNQHRNQPQGQRPEVKELEEKVIQVNRVSKKTKGGNKIGFSVLVVVGDKQGRVGVALGKGPDVLSSIRKGSRRAKKRMVAVPLHKGTIPFPMSIKRGAAKLLLKPAPEGSGVIAGGAVRAVVEAAGVSNIVAKVLGSSNQASNVYATFDALKRIREVATLKGVKLSDSVQVKKVVNEIKPGQDPKKTETAKEAPTATKAKPVTVTKADTSKTTSPVEKKTPAKTAARKPSKKTTKAA